MWQQVERILAEAAQRSVESIAAFLPGVLALTMILLLALLVGALVRVLLLRALRGLEFDRLASTWGMGAFGDWTQSQGLSALVARLAQWMVLVLGLLTGLTALDAAIPSEFALSIFRYVPHVIAALLVLVVGAILAQFLSRAVLIGAVNMQIHYARTLSVAVRWILLIIAASMALEQLGIGRQILVLAFGILFGGVILAAALAVGMGSQDAVRRALERQARQPADPPVKPLDHV